MSRPYPPFFVGSRSPGNQSQFAYRNERIVVDLAEVDGHSDGRVGEASAVVRPRCVALIPEPLAAGETQLGSVRLHREQQWLSQDHPVYSYLSVQIPRYRISYFKTHLTFRFSTVS
jgi:hypothetical protein